MLTNMKMVSVLCNYEFVTATSSVDFEEGWNYTEAESVQWDSTYNNILLSEEEHPVTKKMMDFGRMDLFYLAFGEGGVELESQTSILLILPYTCCVPFSSPTLEE